MKNLTYSLLKLPQTVFTAREIALILGETNADIVKSKINYYVKRGEVVALRRGIYAKDYQFNKFELATKIYTPSYVSFDTVLSKNNIVFQYDSRISLASYLTREIEVNGVHISYKKLKTELLNDPRGIIYENNFPEAIPERALMDSIYLSGARHFDNLGPIDFDICDDLLPVYGGKITKETLKSYVNDR